MVLGAFMTIGTLPEAQQRIVKLRLVSPDGLSERETVPGTSSQRSWFLSVRKSKEVVAAMAAAARHEYVRTTAGERWKFCPAVRRPRGWEK